MSYSPTARPRLSARPARGLQGFVSYSNLLSLQASPTWYVALIETYNTTTYIRSYAWTAPRYLSFWDMNTWDASLNQTISSSVRQAPMMYYWNGTSWVQLTDDTADM